MASALLDQYGYPLVKTQSGLGVPPDVYDVDNRDQQPDKGRVFRVRREDQLEQAWPGDYSPKKIRSVLTAAANRQPDESHQAFDQMLENDPTLPGIYETRINAIRNRQWQVVPATEVINSDDVDESAAQDAADYCRSQLSAIPALDDGLEHLLDAIGRSVSACEIVWQPDGNGHTIAALIPVHHRAVIGDPTYPWKIRVKTADMPYPGLPAEAMPNKWIFHVPRAIGRSPFRGGTHRICLPLHSSRRHGFQWWIQTLELFGAPIRTGEYRPNATNQEKSDLAFGLENIGGMGWALFPPETKVNLITAMQGAEKWPHQKLMDAISDWFAILLLGQTLTTNPGDRGTQALGVVHDRVREDVRDSDIANEGRTIRRDLLAPLVRLSKEFGTKPDTPIPFFRRIVVEAVDYQAESTKLDTAVNKLKLKVKNSHAYGCLDIPLPDPKDVDPNGFVEGQPAPMMVAPGDSSPDNANPPATPPLKKAASTISENPIPAADGVIDPHDCQPLNGLQHPDTFNRMVRDMQRGEWNWPPVLIEEGEINLCWTGSHRTFAARKTGTQMPYVCIDADKAQAFLVSKGFDGITSLRDYFDSYVVSTADTASEAADDERAVFLASIGDERGAQMMQLEILHEREQRKLSKKKVSGSAVPAVPSKSRPASPLGVLTTWIGHATDAARVQVKTIIDHCAESVGQTAAAPEAVHRLVRGLPQMPVVAFTGAIGDYMVASAMAGAYVGQERIIQRRGKRIADDVPAEDVFAKPFRAAIDALAQRIKLAPDDFLRLETEARSRAGRVAGEFNLRIVHDVYKAIQDTLTGGGTKHDFRAAIKQLPSSAGWTGPDPWHANLVFGQNAAMSFNAGNYAAMQDAGIGYWKFRTYLDVDEQNPCPICRPMDGTIFADSDRMYYPPLHFNCRCYADPVFDEEVPERGPSKSAEVDNPEYAKSQQSRGAFRYDPAAFARVEPMNLSAVPDDLRGAFQQYAAAHGWQTQ